MKKHLGLFISIFLAVITISGALFVFDNKNSTTITSNISESYCTIDNVALEQQDEPTYTANAIPEIDYSKVSGSRNTYNFYVTNPSSDSSAYQWFKRKHLELTASPIGTGTTLNNVEINDYIYYIYVVDTSNGNTPSEQITIIPKHIVTFNCGNGAFKNPNDSIQEVQIFSNITRPANPIRDGYIFGGWYTDIGFNNLWDINDPKQQVEEDTTLYAKWVKLLCIGEYQDATNSILKESFVRNNTLIFSINVQYGDVVSWYVNDKLIKESGSTFEYTPEFVGNHSIYCKVYVDEDDESSATKSNIITWPVIYYTPTDISVVSNRNDRTSYTLRINHPHLRSIDISKFAWYCNNELIVEGVYEYTFDISSESEIYAIYKGNDDENIKSNTITISPKSDLLNIPLILGIGGSALLLICLLVFIRKKYIRYRNRKYATFFTWHKW